MGFSYTNPRSPRPAAGTGFPPLIPRARSEQMLKLPSPQSGQLAALALPASSPQLRPEAHKAINRRTRRAQPALRRPQSCRRCGFPAPAPPGPARRAMKPPSLFRRRTLNPRGAGCCGRRLPPTAALPPPGEKAPESRKRGAPKAQRAPSRPQPHAAAVRPAPAAPRRGQGRPQAVPAGVRARSRAAPRRRGRRKGPCRAAEERRPLGRPRQVR